MNDNIVASVVADLQLDEGLRLTVYDDSTGRSIVSGETPIGHPTIGYGRALDTHGITEQEALYLLSNDVTNVVQWCVAYLPWFASLDIVRQRAIANMRFQLGATGLLSFVTFLHFCSVENWSDAQKAMLDSLWAKQTPARAAKYSHWILTGDDVS